MSVLAEIEMPFLALGGESFDRILSGDVIEALLPAYADGASDAKAVGARVESWVSQNGSWLRERLEGHRREGTGSVFASQPELLLILELLSSRSNALVPLWSKVFDLDDLQSLAADFGYSVPGL